MNYTISFVVKPELKSEILKLFNSLGNDYLCKMKLREQFLSHHGLHSI